MFSLLKHLLQYLRRPYLAHLPAVVEKPWWLLCRLLLICLGTALLSLVLTGLLQRPGLIKAPAGDPDAMEMPFYQFAAMAVLVSPLLEELLFRAQLRRLSAGILFLSFSLGALLSLLTGTRWALLISPFIFLPLFILYRSRCCYSLRVKYDLWKRLFPWHFYFTASGFALVHLLNYQPGSGLFPAGLPYLLPQLCTGLVLGYTRMNYGLKYAVLLHVLYNAVPVLLLLWHY